MAVCCRNDYKYGCSGPKLSGEMKRRVKVAEGAWGFGGMKGDRDQAKKVRKKRGKR